MNLLHVESLFVISLFLIYLLLWGLKRRFQIKTTGIDPEVFDKAKNPLQKYFAIFIKFITIILVILIILLSLRIQYYSAFSPFPPLDNYPVDLSGFFIGLFGLGICAIAQRTMGNSWRVGIDEEKKTDLITNGIFKYIRNPTYSGLMLLLIGTWLIWPTWAIGTYSLIFFLFIEIQVRCEEEYLLINHGDKYRNYLSKTCRYIPVKILFKRK